jgi:hypothetical protein
MSQTETMEWIKTMPFNDLFQMIQKVKIEIEKTNSPILIYNDIVLRKEMARRISLN